MINRTVRRMLLPSAVWAALLLPTGNYGADLVPKDLFVKPPAPRSEVFITHVTAYSSSVDETDDDPFITASGARVRDGIVACPRRYPFGTKIVIEGTVYECLDRLALKNDHKIDIWKPDKQQALEFGIRKVEVEAVFKTEEASADREYAMLEMPLPLDESMAEPASRE